MKKRYNILVCILLILLILFEYEVEVFMKVMTFNIKHIVFEDVFWMWKKRYKKAVELIKNENPDIVGFQEITWKSKRFIEKSFPDYYILGKSRHSKLLSNEYNSLMIRRKYELISYKTYSLSDNINKLGTMTKDDKYPRICVIAHIKDKKNYFMIVNTHIDNSDGNNKKRLLDIYKKIINDELKENEYVILVGDYNMTIDNKNLLEFSNDYVDPFKNYEVGSYPDRPDVKALDHIFLDKRLSFSCDRIHTESNDSGFISDHNPVSCRVHIKK